MKIGCAILPCFLLFNCVLGSLSSGKSKKETKDDSSVQGKVVGGQNVSITTIPYMVSVSKAPNEHFCGGSIIHPNFVLTAAHCVQGMSASKLFVRTGSTTVNSGGEVTGIQSVIIYPRYNPITVEHDVALLLTKRPITTGAMIRIADREPAPGLWALVTGWGVKDEKSKTPMTIAQAAWLPTLPRELCAQAYASINKVTSKMICAGYKAGGTDACQGDSGGPMVVNDRQAGVVSWGKGCARRGSPGIYTNLADPEINAWIHRYIGRN